MDALQTIFGYIIRQNKRGPAAIAKNKRASVKHYSSSR